MQIRIYFYDNEATINTTFENSFNFADMAIN